MGLDGVLGPASSPHIWGRLSQIHVVLEARRWVLALTLSLTSCVALATLHPFLGLTSVICEMKKVTSRRPHRFVIGEGKGSELLPPLLTLARPRAGWRRYVQCGKQIPGSTGFVPYVVSTKGSKSRGEPSAFTNTTLPQDE